MLEREQSDNLTDSALACVTGKYQATTTRKYRGVDEARLEEFVDAIRSAN